MGTTAYSFQELCLIAPQCDDDDDDKAVEECSIIVVPACDHHRWTAGGELREGKKHEDKAHICFRQFLIVG